MTPQWDGPFTLTPGYVSSFLPTVIQQALVQDYRQAMPGVGTEVAEVNTKWSLTSRIRQPASSMGNTRRDIPAPATVPGTES